jgi:hypothetical protein
MPFIRLLFVNCHNCGYCRYFMNHVMIWLRPHESHLNTGSSTSDNNKISSFLFFALLADISTENGGSNMFVPAHQSAEHDVMITARTVIEDICDKPIRIRSYCHVARLHGV